MVLVFGGAAYALLHHDRMVFWRVLEAAAALAVVLLLLRLGLRLIIRVVARRWTGRVGADSTHHEA